jgi:hypothetical protein
VKTPHGFTHKYHPQPRLSANQVGDYLSANATNRRRILKEAKYPPTVLLIRYEDAKTALVSHLTSDGTAENVLDKRLQALRRKADEHGMTDYKKTNCHLSIDAIESFQGYEAKMDVRKDQVPKTARSLFALEDIGCQHIGFRRPKN